MVRDLGAPGARLLEIDLPDGGRVRVAEHLCGWTPAADPEGPLWPTMADAVAALSGRTRDGEPWISVLEEFATSPANPGGEILPAEEDARLAALLGVVARTSTSTGPAPTTRAAGTCSSAGSRAAPG